jgi:hypothetical protein
VTESRRTRADLRLAGGQEQQIGDLGTQYDARIPGSRRAFDDH